MRKLTLAETAQIAEILAAVAVVISLLWVAVQIDLNTKEIRYANAQRITALAIENRFRSIEAGIPALTEKARADEELTDVERRVLRLYYQYIFQEFELVHYQYVHERLDQTIMDAWEQRLRLTLGDEVGRSQWEETREIYSLPFRSFVDSISRDGIYELGR